MHSGLVDVYISSVDVVLNFNECAYMCVRVCVTVVLTTFAVYSVPRVCERGREGEIGRGRGCVCAGLFVKAPTTLGVQF